MRLDKTYAKDSIHDNWESMYRDNPLLDRRNDDIMDRILSLVQPPEGAKFLDAGCGVGDHTARIVRRGYDCLGVDISPTILERAERRMAAMGLGGRARFRCIALEDLGQSNEAFDVIHCRGVLMHIPAWKEALRNLCSVLRPGGHIAVLENNVRSPYVQMHLFMRGVHKRLKGGVASRRVDGPDGTELWTDEDGAPYVVRLANMGALGSALREFDVEPTHRFSTSIVAIERLPNGWARNAAIRLNGAAFRMRVPPALCKGNVVIGRKRAEPGG